MDRRQFLSSAALSTSLAAATANAETPARKASREPGRRPRKIYFNDARHHYLYAFEPPMTREDAHRPVDELASTAIDTFIYGVETGGGLFSDTKVGKRFAADDEPFDSSYYWRAHHNMQSLIDQGLDPLQVLIDRAHEHDMDFITSFRMGGGPSDPRYRIGVPGAGGGGGGAREKCQDFARPEVRAARFEWLEELASYPVEGIEYDFAFMPHYFNPDEIKAQTGVLTDYVRRLSEMIRGKGENRIVGARVFPSLEMNLALGLDVGAWLSERLVDYVAPLFYGYFLLDPDMPFESMAETAHAAGAEVYAVLQPYFMEQHEHATPAMIRAAAANYWDKGADALIVAPWFYWPFRDEEKSMLTDVGAPQDILEKDKHYFVAPRREDAAVLGYDHPLPLSLSKIAGPSTAKIPFYVADDTGSTRVERVRLQMRVDNLVTDDRLELKLNGQSLRGEIMRRTSHRYEYQWLDFELAGIRPRQGQNVLEVSLESRPPGLHGSISVVQLEILVEYALPHSGYTRPEML